MQKVSSLRKVRTPVTREEDEQRDILHFSLQGLLPTDNTLALNTLLGTLSHLSCVDNLPVIVGEQQFTTSEISVLLPLLEAYPYYSPYEVLLASFTTGRTSETAVVRTRLKTRRFGIEISSIIETGYIMMVKKKSRRTT